MIQPNPYFTIDWYLSKEASYQKGKKLSSRFWEMNILSDTLTTDDEALEKLRCLPAGATNKTYGEFTVAVIIKISPRNGPQICAQIHHFL